MCGLWGGSEVVAEVGGGYVPCVAASVAASSGRSFSIALRRRNVFFGGGGHWRHCRSKVGRFTLC